ncbi:ATP-grasp domain-containing protein [Candidatus Nomurabacteria bacterium]|nr:ATP-grasp domain-containing protein [Candidatus Nomurabacteria bacterium]
MKIAIITGGTSSEREVSLASAQNIQRLLSIPDDAIFDYPEDLTRLKDQLADIDVVIPIIHGAGGEDGEVQQALENLRIPYIFSIPTCHQQALDKQKAKEIVSQAGIPVAREFSSHETISSACFVKPRSGGSSLYTTVVNNPQELSEFVNQYPDIDFLIEERITGREFTVGVIETNGETKALPVTEIISQSEFFDYNSKYNTAKLAHEICPAEISIELAKELQRQAVNCHNTLGCRHLSRTDFIVTPENTIYFLETNTIPGMTSTSLAPQMAKVAKYNLKDLFHEWIQDVL